MQVSVLRGQVDAAKAAVAENSVMLADAVLKYNAEDWLWRKRYRTLHMRHRRWLADVKRKANLKDSSAEAIVADLSAIAAEWDAEGTVQETLGEDVDAASTLLAVEKNVSTAGAAVAAATFSSLFLANEARTEVADAMAAATATALAAENSRKEVAGLFAEAVAAAAAAAAATATAAAAAAAAAAEEKKEAEFLFAAAKKLFADASLKEAASDRALAGVAALEMSTEEALAVARAKTVEAALATATAKRATWSASKRSAIRSTDAVHGTPAFAKWRKRQRDALVDFLVELFGSAWEIEFVTNASPGDKARIAAPNVAQRSADPQDVVEVLDFFFKRYQKLFDVIGDPVKRRGKNIAAIGESLTAGAIKEHFDKVVIAMHTQCALTEHAYQALINYTSNVYIEGEMHIVVVSCVVGGCGGGIVDDDNNKDDDDDNEVCDDGGGAGTRMMRWWRRMRIGIRTRIGG